MELFVGPKKYIVFLGMELGYLCVLRDVGMPVMYSLTEHWPSAQLFDTKESANNALTAYKRFFCSEPDIPKARLIPVETRRILMTDIQEKL